MGIPFWWLQQRQRRSWTKTTTRSTGTSYGRQTTNIHTNRAAARIHNIECVTAADFEVQFFFFPAIPSHPHMLLIPHYLSFVFCFCGGLSAENAMFCPLWTTSSSLEFSTQVSQPDKKTHPNWDCNTEIQVVASKPASRLRWCHQFLADACMTRALLERFEWICSEQEQKRQ